MYGAKNLKFRLHQKCNKKCKINQNMQHKYTQKCFACIINGFQLLFLLPPCVIAAVAAAPAAAAAALRRGLSRIRF